MFIFCLFLPPFFISFFIFPFLLFLSSFAPFSFYLSVSFSFFVFILAFLLLILIAFLSFFTLKNYFSFVSLFFLNLWLSFSVFLFVPPLNRMKLFSEVFGSLSEDRRDEISRWMRERVMEIDPVCLPNQVTPSVPPKPMQASASASPDPVTDAPSPCKSLLTLSAYEASNSRYWRTEVCIITSVSLSYKSTGLSYTMQK